MLAISEQQDAADGRHLRTRRRGELQQRRAAQRTHNALSPEATTQNLDSAEVARANG
jgi:hypothetical protein